MPRKCAVPAEAGQAIGQLNAIPRGRGAAIGLAAGVAGFGQEILQDRG
jgi:hypothetical protein